MTSAMLLQMSSTETKTGYVAFGVGCWGFVRCGWCTIVRSQRMQWLSVVQTSMPRMTFGCRGSSQQLANSMKCSSRETSSFFLNKKRRHRKDKERYTTSTTQLNHLISVRQQAQRINGSFFVQFLVLFRCQCRNQRLFL